MLPAMDAPSVAETLPETYRRVLDRVADLETAGYRREADLVRSDAIAAYSRRWNARTAVRLDRLTERAERVLDGRERARAPYHSRRASAAIWLAAAPARIRRRLARRNGRNRAGGPGGMTLERPTA
jgi:hypothetical protein